MNPATMFRLVRLIDSVIADASQFGWNGREIAEVRPYFRVVGGAS